MHFDGGQALRRNGIAQGDAVVGKGARVKEQGLLLGLVHGVDQLSFVVGLEHAHLYFEPLRMIRDQGIDIGQSLPTVDIGFTRAQQIEIGSV